MRRNTRKRSKTTQRAIAAAAGLALGAGGLIAVSVYASAHESGNSNSTKRASQGDQVLSAGAVTISCPDVGAKLMSVPDRARALVDKELALLDQQVAEAYQRLRNSARAVQQDSSFADNAIMGPLKNKRAATIDRIAITIGRSGPRPQGLEALAACSLRASGNQQGNAAGQGGNGPVASDFVDITTVQPNVRSPRTSRGASTGTFTTRCGVNANKLYNSDNIIVAPGVGNGAHHTHDYVGNQDNDAFTTNEEFAAAGTSCRNQGDRSTYYWPVLRLQDGTREFDAKQLGGGAEGNTGRILTASKVTLNFVGSPRGKVVAMPKFLRIITGDAKAFTNGTANANAAWSCTGFENRQLTDRYPICPRGSKLVRTSTFQSCWDGRSIDSANHRSHVAFADRRTGACPTGFKAIPQLVQRLVYSVAAPSLDDNGKTRPFYAVDGFPEQMHKPITDHGDFINVLDERLMNRLVQCINTGRKCQ
ncbi:DUF1996 domain-containing protein [Streptomyces acidiscabies]|uniref:DUF1996 domain-containing protein n=1 Tax=Streptomyces acidiscabies TaxID=42234 RepID=A0AAP6EIF0_9ACTN|nr:DUF1996 domain-containing protein [Streptomyces acidiscabies]MBZ3913573.1 DUF1996 domain-containing protein [Streptomyces acidiscabies]MDX2963411.1 DUF1996 domain-containing protein [Streptomyces acidiscabies]MDX3023145.1 DUF1996 domain-containing protein [Streptomyces acidiscabies]MDX3792711.1 DUF1996 domain-containing protein [Streptomyces acidiscabies]GAQ51343.1 hypothetical protein a10_01123 [Streptomyces acidiscabies]